MYLFFFVDTCGFFETRYFYLFSKILASEIFFFCWQIILLILSNIFPIFFVLFLRADFSQCKTWILDPKMVPIQSNKSCPPGAYAKNVCSFWVYFQGMQPAEYVPQC